MATPIGIADNVPVMGLDGMVRWLTPQVASHRRIYSHDTISIRNWAKHNGILDEMRFTMLSQLELHCSIEPGSQILSLHEGAQLVQRYTSLGRDEQMRWLLADLRAREVIHAFDVAKTAYNTPATALSNHAVSLRMSINSQQINQLNQMLSAQSSAKVAGLRSADQAGSRTVSTSMPAPQRVPLAESSRNIPARPRTPPEQSTKRKREDPKPANPSDMMPTGGEESEDEDSLQGQEAALQARIAAIRARTTHDDELMPRKKATTAAAATTIHSKPSTIRHGPRLAAQSIPPSSSTRTPMTSELTEDGLLVTSTTVTRENGGSTKHSVVYLTNKQGLPLKPARSVRLILTRQGQPDYRLSAPHNLDFARIATMAKKQFSVNAAQPVCLHFDGQRLSATETVEEADLQDHAILKVFDLPRFVVHKQETKATMAFGKAERAATPPSTKPGPAQPVIDLISSSPPHIVAEPAPAPPPAPAAPVQVEPVLCREQQEVVDLIAAGHNVFYTGSAGCGKSTVLKAFTARLRDTGKTVRIVAPTGKAALDINGSTTWTYAGWTPGHMKKPLEELVKGAYGKFVSKRFKSTDVLVIDEISMVESHLLERLSHIMQAARGNYKPFGGVQLVVTGDFCQLPPVKAFQFCMFCGREHTRVIGPNRETLYRCPQHGDCNDDDKWAFKSKVWEKCEFKHINLTEIHRQSDQVFIGILQKLRIGKPLTNADRQLLLDHPCDVKNAVKLFPTREEVRRINQTEFDKLVTAKREYRCLDYFRWNQEHGNLREKGRRSPVDNSLEALREHRLEPKVEFKANMLVVLLVNLDIANGLVNGSQGRVIGFEPYDESKLPKAAVFEGGSFSSSSRGRGAKKGRGGRAASPEPSQAIVQEELRGEYASLREGQIKDFILQPCNTERRWPIVLFDNGIRRTIYADCQVNELGDDEPYTLLARTQIPLLAAWAMTIHKSQGMTLNKVIVDLGRSFEEGQEYVALSRARSLDGLQVVSLGSNVGTGGNEQVKKFLKEKFTIG